MNREIPRRKFLRDTAVAASAVGLAIQTSAQAASGERVERFQYDIDRFRKVDPALIQYKPVARLGVPKPEPRRLAVGPDQRLYVAAGTSLVVLDERGGLRREIATGGAVRSVAVAGDGTIHAGVKDHVEVFDARGRRIATWDAEKGRPLLTGIAVAESDVFVADAGNRSVWRYDRSGTRRGRIGEKDAERNIPGFVIPSPYFDVKVGADGLLRVANPGRRRVETYTFDGDLEFAWGKPGAAIDAFCGCCNPCNIEVLADGRVVTFEKGLPRVKIFSARGQLECVVAGPDSFADPARAGSAREGSFGGLDGAVDSQGRVYVLDLTAGDIQVFAPKEPAMEGGVTRVPASA